MAIKQLRLFKVKPVNYAFLICDMRAKGAMKVVSNVKKCHQYLTNENASIYWPGEDMAMVGRPIGSYDSLLRRINANGQARVIRQLPGKKADSLLIQKLPIE